MTVLIFLLLLNPSVQAAVDTQSGTYVDQWVDMEVSGTNYNFPIKRAYNHKFVDSGIFGSGWCSNLEAHLKQSSNKEVTVFECGKGARERYIRQKSDPNFFQSNLRRQNHLKKKGKTWIRKVSHSTYQHFNHLGKLIQIDFGAKSKLEFNYQANILTSISGPNGFAVKFKYDVGKRRVVKISTSKGRQSVYKYKKKLLKIVKNSLGKEYQFNYDNVNRLVRIDYPNKSNAKIHYLKMLNAVSFIEESKPSCRTQYRYNDRTEKLVVGIERRCGGKLQKYWKDVYEYAGSGRPRVLKKYWTSNQNRGLQFDKNGRVRSVKDKKIGLKKIDRDQYGRVKKISQSQRTASYYYRKGASQIEKIYLDYASRNKSNRSEKYFYKYNSEGQLNSIKLANGDRVNIRRDKFGRPVFLKESGQEVIKISYKKNTSEPSEIWEGEAIVANLVKPIRNLSGEKIDKGRLDSVISRIQKVELAVALLDEGL